PDLLLSFFKSGLRAVDRRNEFTPLSQQGPNGSDFGALRDAGDNCSGVAFFPAEVFGKVAESLFPGRKFRAAFWKIGPLLVDFDPLRMKLPNLFRSQEKGFVTLQVR